MGTLLALDPVKIAGTADPARLAILIRILSHRPDLNTRKQVAQLAAAKQLMGGKTCPTTTI